jgi:hypothetical protein
MLVICAEDGCMPPVSRWAPRIGVVNIRRFRHVDLHGSCWGFRGALRKIGCVRVFVDSGRAWHRVRWCGHFREVDCGIQPSCGLVSHSECFGVDNEQGMWTVYLRRPCSRRKSEAPKRRLETFFCRASKCVVKEAGREGAILNRASVHCLWSWEPPPGAGPADHNSWCSFFLVNFLVWWGLSCDLFLPPFPLLSSLAATR